MLPKTSTEDDSGFAVKVKDDGRIVVAGWAKVNGVSKFALARYLADGALEAVTIPAIGDADQEAGAYAVGIQSDGKIVAAGQAFHGDTSKITLVRWNEDGSLDAAFGEGNGVAPATFGSQSVPWSSGGKALILGKDGSMVAAGWVRTPGAQGTDFAVVRFDKDGKLDSAFNSTGLVNVDLGYHADDHVYGLAHQEERIMVVGNTYNGADKDLAIVRLNSDGTLDSSFADSGIRTMDYSGSTHLFQEVIVGESGEMYVGGAITLPTPAGYFAVACFDQDGELNASFGAGGFLLTAVDQNQSNSLHMVRQKDGKIVQVGTVTTTSKNTDGAIARYQ